MKKAHIFLALILLLQINVSAQDVKPLNEKKLWVSIEGGYGIGTVTGSDYWDYGFGSMNLRTLRVKTGYYFTPQISIGAGIGLNRYNCNTLPVFAEVRYHPFKLLPKLYAYADMGSSISSYNHGNFSPGFIFDLGTGYKIRLGKRTSLNPSVSYNLFAYTQTVYLNQDMRYESIEYDGHRQHSLVFRLEFEF